VALVFQVRALDRRALVQRLGELDLATLDQILDLLADLTK
jgi:mRNA-degrading endonuclease toxin of MazEF toxin-antitoxin module